MSETPAQELRKAAAAISLRADCGPGSFWSAVADWLDERANLAAGNLILETPECTHEDGPCHCGREPAWACNICLGWLDAAGEIGGDSCECFSRALAVARAYLGTKEGSDG